MQMKNIEFDTIKVTNGMLSNINYDWNKELKEIDAEEKAGFVKDLGELYEKLKSGTIELLDFSNSFLEVLAKHKRFSEYCARELEILNKYRNRISARELIDVSDKIEYYINETIKSVEEIFKKSNAEQEQRVHRNVSRT